MVIDNFLIINYLNLEETSLEYFSKNLLTNGVITLCAKATI